MKRLALLFSILLSSLAAQAAILYEWPADVDHPIPAVFEAFEGETVELACRVVRNRRDYPLFATNATCFFQTNGMGPFYWSAPATVDGSLMRATLGPADVPSAPALHVLLGSSGPSGIVYRANAILRYLPSPGATPNVLPLPTPSIDFAAVAWTNAPWAVTAPGTNAPAMDGEASPGSMADYARADHVHPAETAATRLPPTSDDLRLPASAFPITFSISGVTYSAEQSDIEILSSGSGATLFADGYGICDFDANGVFSFAWMQAEDLRFGGESPAPGDSPALDSGCAVSVRGVPVATMADLVAATNALFRLINH